MSYTIERFDNPRHYRVKINEDFDAGNDIKQYFEDLCSRLDLESTPITSIVDIMDIRFSVNALLQSTKDLQALKVNPAQHPMSEHLILISNSPMMRLSIDGFRKFGIVKTVHIVETLGEALTLLASQNRDSA